MSEPALSHDRTALLTQQLSELLKDGNAEAFLREVAARSDAGGDSHWDVLAVVDRLYRSPKLSPQLFRLARMGIERRALGFTEPVSSPSERELHRMRGELARAQLEAAAQRERAQRLERELEETASQLRRSPAGAVPGKTARSGLPAPKPAATPKAAPAVPADTGRAAKRPSFRARQWLLVAGSCVVLLAVLGAGVWLHERRAKVMAEEEAARNAAAARAAQASAVVSAPVPVVSGELAFESDRYVVDPDQKEVTITVRRTAGTAGELSVEWRAANGGARAGRDFVLPTSLTLAFADGQDSAQIVIPILGNASRVHTEFFDLQLIRGNGGGSLGKQRRTTVFLLPGAGGPRTAGAAQAGG